MKAKFARPKEAAPKKEIELLSEEMKQRVATGSVCPYCGKEPTEALLSDIYTSFEGDDKLMAYCADCNAMTAIGHNGPYGRLADQALRTLRGKIYNLRIKLQKQSVEYKYLRDNPRTIQEAFRVSGIPNTTTKQITDLSYSEAKMVLEFLQEIDNL